MICVECNFVVPAMREPCVLCPKCGLKIDKYSGTSDTYKILDCLLLKQQVFCHFLVNCKIPPFRFFKFLFFQLAISLFCFNSSVFAENSYFIRAIYSDLFYTVLVTTLLHYKFRPGNISYYNIVFGLVFSSFYNYLKILFVIWQYSELYYFFVLEMMNTFSNICALKANGINHLHCLVLVLLSKGCSWMIYLPSFIKYFFI